MWLLLVLLWRKYVAVVVQGGMGCSKRDLNPRQQLPIARGTHLPDMTFVEAISE